MVSVSTSYSMPIELHRRLETRAEEEDKHKSEVVRDAVRAYLGEKEE